MSHTAAALFVPALFLLAAMEAPLGAAPAAAANAGDMVAHRAVYDLKLSQTRGKLASVRGRILYDFSGSVCEGYTLQFRQVTELDNGEGKVATSDLRSTTWEDGEAKTFRFNFQNFLNQIQLEAVDGNAERRDAGVSVALKNPADKRFDIDASTVFPTEHMRRIVAGARAGQSLLELPVYDGSESGEKLYNTLTVIGREIAPDGREPTDAAAGQATLKGMKRWPISISYFDKSKTDGEQTPAYSIAFELYDNGISRALSLDYGDFVISGEMTTLEIKPAKPCP